MTVHFFEEYRAERFILPESVKWLYVPLSIRRILKARAAQAGIEGVSGHSLRVGAAQSMAASGATLVDMQVAGRWRSPQMPALYARHQLAGSNAVARIRYGCG